MPSAPRGGLGTDDWLAAFRRACDGIGEAAAAMAPARRREPVGPGAGGDVTVRIDRVAEDVVLGELTALGVPMTVVTEEAGELALAGGGPPWVVVDPIDGSLNAKRGLPVFSTSLALADGPAMGDVLLGLVRDHGTGEEWTAVRGAGARLDGAVLAPPPAPEDERLELLLVEGAYPSRLGAIAAHLDGRVGRVRALGSLALSLCHLAGGRGDAMAALAPGRSVDVAAAQLVVREAGLLVGMPGADDTAAAPLGLDARFPVVAAHDAATLALLARAATG